MRLCSQVVNLIARFIQTFPMSGNLDQIAENNRERIHEIIKAQIKNDLDILDHHRCDYGFEIGAETMMKHQLEDEKRCDHHYKFAPIPIPSNYCPDCGERLKGGMNEIITRG